MMVQRRETDRVVEANLAQNVKSYQSGAHPGYEPNALSGLTLSLQVAVEKKIKLVVNGGALNPRGLAERVTEMVGHNIPCTDQIL